MEFPDLGSSCSKCSELDFLPFVCVYCAQVLCKEHLLPAHHGCLDYNENTVQEETVTKQEAKIRCKFCKEHIAQSLEGVSCPKCSQIHCLKHRLPESHECPKLKEEYLQRIRSHRTVSSVEKKPVEAPKVKGAKNDSLARKVALMKLKQKAKGPQVPMEERLYLFVENETTGSQEPFYYSKTWTFGKCLDFTLETLGMRNVNNKTSGKKMSFCLLDGEAIAFDVTVQEVFNKGCLSDGDKIILKNVD